MWFLANRKGDKVTKPTGDSEMLFNIVKKSGRVFSTEKALTQYLNRVCGYLKGKGKSQRTTAAHKQRIINLWKSKQTVTPAS